MSLNGYPLQQNLEDAGCEPYAYSGRAMYGKECVAVDIDGSIGNFFADFLTEMGETLSGEELEEAVLESARAFRGMQTDSMGRGLVLYFPNVEFVSEEEVGS